MKKLYVQGNYIIKDDNGTITRFAMKNSYNEKGGNFVVKQGMFRGSLIIALSDAVNWLDAAVGGSNYTEATMRTFFEDNTAFRSASGGRGAADFEVSISSANIKDFVAVQPELLAALGAGKYFSDIFLRFKYTEGGEGYVLAADTFLKITLGSIEKLITTDFIMNGEDAVVEISDYFTDQWSVDEEKPYASPQAMNQQMTLGILGVNDFEDGDGTLEVEIWTTPKTF